MTTDTELGPIVKTIELEGSPSEAFALFTEGIATWWPTGTHSVAEDDVETVVFEPGVGGRIFERWRNGHEHDWGTVTTWEPPSRIVYSWKPNHERADATEVEIVFTATEDGTKVRLEHRGWELLGADGAEARGSYYTGWDLVLGGFAAAA